MRSGNQRTAITDDTPIDFSPFRWGYQHYGQWKAKSSAEFLSDGIACLSNLMPFIATNFCAGDDAKIYIAWCFDGQRRTENIRPHDAARFD